MFSSRSLDLLSPEVVPAVCDVPAESWSSRGDGDRRKRPTPMLSRYVIAGGRRRDVRREKEREGAFVDVHGHQMILMVLVIMLLNLLDAGFTLLFLSHGGQELNPFVQVVLDLGSHPWPFVLCKTAGIGILCAFLVLTKNFRPAMVGLWVVLIGYTALLGWHLYLAARLDTTA